MMLPSAQPLERKPTVAVRTGLDSDAGAKRPPQHEVAPEFSARSLQRSDRTQHVVSQRGNAWFFHDVVGVSRFFSANKYTCFIDEGTEHYALESLSSLEARLEPLGFMRAHRAELINLAHVRSIVRVRHTFEVVLDDGQRVIASRRLVHALRQRLGF